MRWLCGVFALLCLSAPASAILIDAGAGGRVGGYFVRDDGKKLTIRVRLSNGKEKLEEFDRVKIKILHQIDRARLEKLSREEPKAYRDYADELAEQKADPEARDMAMRLHLIAAHLDPKQYGRSSLMSMSTLASTPAEARRCRALAYLLDPKAEANVLKPPVAAPPPKADAAALLDFQRALQHFRTGRALSALDLAKKTGVEHVFSQAPGMMEHKAFRQACADSNCPACGKTKTKGKVVCTMCNGAGSTVGMLGNFQTCPTCKGQKWQICTTCDGAGSYVEITEETMRMLLRAELWSVEQLSGIAPAAPKAGNDGSWSTALQAGRVSPVTPLSLETVTEFDPRKCHYRNGVWTEK